MSKVGKLNKDASSVSEEKDPERLLKLKECCDILLAGGYFRARIPTLSPFDKVVGGVVWAMTASAVDIEVDIIFTENSTIGQKIKLSDQICKSLVAMKCPYPLQSHQIQGLDYDHLFPILQWLVRKVIETRRIMGDVVRAQSCQQFDKFFQKFPSELIDDSGKDKIKTQRKFKKKLNANFDNIYSRVEATLLEYGEKLYGLGKAEEESESGGDKGNKGKNRSSLINKFETGKTAEQKKKEEEELKKKKQEEEEQRLKSLEEQLLSAGVGGKISGANVGSLIGMQADEIRRAAEDYEAQLKKQIEEEEASGASSKKGQEAAHNRAIDAIKKKINAAGEELKKKEGSQQESQQKLEELKELLNKKLAYNEKIIRETEKLDAIEGEGNNKEILIKLRSLVAMNETLKSQEAAFKAQCIQERNDIMDQLKKLEGGEGGAAGGGDEEIKKMLEIESIYENDLGKLNKIRRVLAKKNQEISKILRQIDDIPTRAELIQYERRFIELYELVASKLIETRKYYSMYNTLSDSHRYMSQEVNLLNSIIESFPKAINSSVKSNRDNFIEQMEKILDGVDKTKAMVKNQSDEEGNNRELLLSKYNQLIDKQRNYFKAVKEFQFECNKNEKLMAALESGIPMDEINIEKNDD